MGKDVQQDSIALLNNYKLRIPLFKYTHNGKYNLLYFVGTFAIGYNIHGLLNIK